MRMQNFSFGEWQVDAGICTLRQDTGESIQIEPRAMDVLVTLCSHPGDVLSAQDLLRLCWDGLAVGENQVHKAILQLRRALGDSASDARYIENIRKRGYRTIAKVTPSAGSERYAGADWDDDSPYVGLDPFDASRAKVFFGRDAAIARLVDTVAAQLETGRALVLLLGPSGSGKTSLVQAGLVPALVDPARAFHVASVTTLDLGDVGDLPLPSAIGGALLDLDLVGEPLFEGLSAEEIGARLLTNPRSLTAPLPGDARFVLFIDRLEALFNSSTVDDRQRDVFLALLDNLARVGPFIVIAACRNDFYPDVANEPLLMAGKASGGHFDLEPPTRAEIAEMIRRPAQVAGLHFGVDPQSKVQLDDLLCDDAANSPDALPLLQYALQELYLQRSSSRELTLTAYRALGGIDGAIGLRAETVLQSLPEPAQAALPRILSMVVTIGAQDEAVRSHRALWSHLATDDERLLVRTLVEERLFVSFVYDRESVFGVAHEALLRRWPRVVTWIAGHRQALHMRARLDGLARRWVADGRRVDLLLPRGKQLDEARELQKHAEIPLGADALALIEASKRRVRFVDRFRLGALAGFVAISIAAIVLGIRASYAEKLAAQRRLEAEDLMNFMVGDFVEKLKPLGKLDLLDGAAQKALQYLTSEDVAGMPGSARLQQAKALQTLADVSRSRANPAAALQALHQAESLLRANRADGQNDVELAKNLGAVFFYQGQIALDQGRLDDAEQKFRAYHDEARRMNELEPSNADAWIELSYALSNLGGLLQKRGEQDKASAFLEQSIALKRRALAERPDSHGLQADLANSLSWLANAKASVGELQAASDLGSQQRALLEALKASDPNASVWSYRLAIANKVNAGVLAAQGREQEALASLRTGEDTLRVILEKEPTNRVWQRERSIAALHGARILASTGKAGEALATARAAESSLQGLLALDAKSDDVTRALALAHYLQAFIALGENDLTSAEAQIEKSEALLAAIYAKYRTDRVINGEMAQTMLLKSRILSRSGRSDASLSLCKATIQNLSSVSGRESDFRVADPWVRANICAGDRASVAHVIAFMQRIGYNDVHYGAFENHQ